MANSVFLGVKNEDDPSENRVSIVPKDVKSIIDLGIEVEVEKGAGERAGYSDKEYRDSGAKIVNNLSGNINIVSSINAFFEKKSKFIKNSFVISLTDVRTNREILIYVKIMSYHFLQWNLCQE